MSVHDVLNVSGWPLVGDEQLGSKSKFWLRDPEEVRWLFKLPRERAGDDWAEKVTAELGGLIGLPCPGVELALHTGRRGTVTRSFLPRASEVGARLVHGNELLFEIDPTYPRTRERMIAEHTVDAVMGALERFRVEPPMPSPTFDDGREMTAQECFTGYLAFDAWIGNQDRHHENWGILVIEEGGVTDRSVLAPSFDHAASLGQFLLDKEREGRLKTKDRGYAIEAWAAKARSHLYLSSSDSRPASTVAAFGYAALGNREAALHWRQRIAEANMAKVAEVLQAVPFEWMSECARRFALRVLEVNRDALQAMEIE